MNEFVPLAFVAFRMMFSFPRKMVFPINHSQKDGKANTVYTPWDLQSLAYLVHLWMQGELQKTLSVNGN